jgi:hypothetical protein
MNRHRDGFQGGRYEWSHPTAVEAARMYKSWKSKRRGGRKRKNGFRIIITKTRGGMCYRHNSARPEGGL